jgi:hypothetical protein
MHLPRIDAYSERENVTMARVVRVTPGFWYFPQGLTQLSTFKDIKALGILHLLSIYLYNIQTSNPFLIFFIISY